MPDNQPGWAVHRTGLWLRNAAVKIGPAPQAPDGPANGAPWFGTIRFHRIRACRPTDLSQRGPPRMANTHHARPTLTSEKGLHPTHNALDNQSPIRARGGLSPPPGAERGPGPKEAPMPD